MDEGSGVNPSHTIPDIDNRLLAEGTLVASDVIVVRSGISRSQQLEVAAVAHELAGHCDLVVVAVPPGEGVTVHHQIMRLLCVEVSGLASAHSPREAQQEAS